MAHHRHQLTIRLAPIVLAALLIAAGGSGSARAATTPPCNIYDPAGCSVGSNGSAVHGWLLVAGRSTEADDSLSSPDQCAQCSWLVIPECVTSSGQNGPGGQHCAGVYVGCPGIEPRLQIYWAATTGDPLSEVDSYCVGPATGPIVDATIIIPDVRRYAGTLRVSTPDMEVWPPGGTTLVNLPTYFAAVAPGTGTVRFGGDGYSLQLAVSAAQYDWEFGDGTSLDTSSAGGAPPHGTVLHTYAATGRQQVTLTVTYGATYTVTTPVGRFGPHPIPGPAVRTATAAISLDVASAGAVLTG